MSKTKQDPRLTEEELEQVNDFFILVAGNANEEIEMMLEIWPNLIYARDEHGSTPLIFAVGGTGRASDLETVRILMNYNPDLTMRDNDGWTVFTALQGIRDPLLMRQFAQLLDPTIQFEDYAVVEARARENVMARHAEQLARLEHIRAEAIEARAEVDRLEQEARDAEAREARAENNPLAEARDYFNSAEQRQVTATLNAMIGRDPLTDRVVTYNMQEITYDQDLESIFKKLPALNMDEQKKFDQMSFKIDSLLKGISFAPVAFESFSQDQLSIIIIPKELLEFSFKQFSNILGKIYEYFDHSDQE